jgi:ankyrin repeat protein
MKMEGLMLRFPHLPDQIFQKLNNESLFKCREVSSSWQNTIDGKNYPWLRIVNIPTILQNKISYHHLAVETGQIEAFKTAFREEEDKNIKNYHGATSFQLACMNGCFKMVEFLLKNTNLEFNVDAKDDLGNTAFVLACYKGHSNVVMILMENAFTFKIDLNAKNIDGRTAFHHACLLG